MSESNEEWELSKENIQPIQQGRKQKILKSALAPHPEDLILQERQAFEHKLRTYSGDDPLSVWCNYIKWVEQNFPKGGREGHIKQIIEQCLSILGNDKKYFDDDRFIDILLKFANINAKPLEVYTYMYSHNIGCKSATFFISWSWELEQLGNLKRADQVLTEGIQRQVVPFEKIRSYQSEFETRLASKIKEECETNNFESNFGRSAFNMLKPQKKNLAPISRIGEAVVDRRNPLFLPRRDPQSQPTRVSAHSKIPFKIYNSENIATNLPVQSQSVTPAILHSEYKENEQKPSKWNKIKVKPRVHSLRAPDETNPSFKFHCDDENEQQNTYTPRSVPKTSNILTDRCRTPSPVMALFEPPDPFKRAMYPKDKVYGGAEEYSLEEIRAAEWLERKKKRDQEFILKEQEKIIEEQAKNEEELRKKIEHLTKQVQLLQTSSVNSASKPVRFSCVTEMNCSNETPGNLKSTGFNNIKTNSEDNYVPNVRQVPSYLLNSANNESKDTSKSMFSLQSLHKSSYSSADNFENLYIDSTSCLNDQDERQTTNSKNLSIKQVSSNPHTCASNESNDASRKMVSLQNLHKSNYSLTDTSEIKRTDSTSYCEAAKLVQELYNRTLFHPGDETECKTNSQFNFGLDKKCATASSNVFLSDIKEANHTEQKSDMLKELQRDLPFELFHDPTEVVPNSNDLSSKDLGKENLQKNCNLALKSPIIENEDSFDEDGENIPPKGYVEEKSKRELAGILEPSKNIFFIPLEEQELDDSDIDDDLVCQPRMQHADETLVPPSNTEQFSTAMFSASTPCASRNKENKFDSVDLKDKIISLGTSNVPQICLDNQNSAPKELVTLQHIVTKAEEKLPSSHSVLPKVLSVIMETTENSSKSSSSSSSSSSVNLTKSGHLDPCSSNFISVRKPYLKHETFDPYSLSSVSEVPDSNSHVNSSRINEISHSIKIHVEKAEKIKPFLVDFDPFDTKLTLKHLQSITFSKYKNLSKVSRSLKFVKVGDTIKIGDTNYRIECVIAEGAYAKVFEAVAVQSYVFESHLTKDPLNQRIALKVCKKGNEWEFYICCEIQNRLFELNCLPDIKDSVMNITSAIKFTDGIVLANEYSRRGTLLDLVNFYNIDCRPVGVNEHIIMYLTLEILHIVSKLHKLNIIHGDIKPDNFLIKNDAFLCDEKIYDLTKKGNLKLLFMKHMLNHRSESAFECPSKTISCLRLIDFGRAIDLNQYDKGICFTNTFSTSNFKCIEMKENKPWVFQLDWYGVLSCIHTMLFSQYMVVKKKNDKWGIEKKFKRYWCYEKLWEPLFTELLNIPACYQEPNVEPYINIIENELQQDFNKFIAELSRLDKNYTKRK